MQFPGVPVIPHSSDQRISFAFLIDLDVAELRNEDAAWLGT